VADSTGPGCLRDEDWEDELLYLELPPGQPQIGSLHRSVEATRLEFVGVQTEPVPEDYWDRLIDLLDELPEAVDAPGEDPEPFI
jgi:hypothetical protein